MESDSIFNIISKRTSWRSYSDLDIDIPVISRINNLFCYNNNGPFGNNVKLKLISKDDPENKKMKLGTYGFIKGAKIFLVGIIKPGKYNFVDFGYVFEKTILRFSGENLGTCWLGGTFYKGEFARSVKPGNDEIIAAVSPVGYHSENRGISDRLIRIGARSKKRKPFQSLFFIGDLSVPMDPANGGDYKRVLEMVRLAPSASNKQPWRIIKDEKNNIFHFYLSREKNYQKINKKVDLQMIDMGIALSHFDLCASELGLPGKWEVIDHRKKIQSLEYIFSWTETRDE